MNTAAVSDENGGPAAELAMAQDIYVYRLANDDVLSVLAGGEPDLPGPIDHA